MEAQQKRQTTDIVEIIARPIFSKSDLRLHYDENLVFYGVLPIHVGIRNIDRMDCSRNWRVDSFLESWREVRESGLRICNP